MITGSGGTSIKILEAMGGAKSKNVRGACENCHFYAKIVKFGLILAHFKLFEGHQ